MGSKIPSKGWTPPARISYRDVRESARAVVERPPGKLRKKEDVFRISELGMDWDIGGMVYDPIPNREISRGADGKKIGIRIGG